MHLSVRRHLRVLYRGLKGESFVVGLILNYSSRGRKSCLGLIIADESVLLLPVSCLQASVRHRVLPPPALGVADLPFTLIG